jgi:hypothetical protein
MGVTRTWFTVPFLWRVEWQSLDCGCCCCGGPKTQPHVTSVVSCMALLGPSMQMSVTRTVTCVGQYQRDTSIVWLFRACCVCFLAAPNLMFPLTRICSNHRRERWWGRKTDHRFVPVSSNGSRPPWLASCMQIAVTRTVERKRKAVPVGQYQRDTSIGWLAVLRASCVCVSRCFH